MSIDRMKDIADAVLFEGYLLYPYRASAIKNQRRWSFGSLFPRAYEGGEASLMQTEVLLEAGAKAEVDVVARFLQAQRRQVMKRCVAEGREDFAPVAELTAQGRRFVSFEEAIVRETRLSALSLTKLLRGPQRVPIAFQSHETVETIPSGGRVVRSCAALDGRVEVAAERVVDECYRLRVCIENLTPLPKALSRDDAQRCAFLSTHMILMAHDAAFVSLLEPPDSLREAAAACDNRGAWPALAGEPGARDAMLASPIILYDYPRVAPESKSPFFDSTEIDELLTLRVLTLTDAEKREMAATDPRAKGVLDGCEALTERELSELHGAFRDPPHRAAASALAPGAHVRLHPQGRNDILDLALKGKIGVVRALERDFENRVHVAVTLLDDPGGDLGEAGFPGHRFFFSAEELEPLDGGATP